MLFYIGCFLIGVVANVALIIYKKSKTKVETKSVKPTVDRKIITHSEEIYCNNLSETEPKKESHRVKQVSFPLRKNSVAKLDINKDDFFQFRNGSSTIRILPNPNGGRFWETAEQHYLGKDNVVQCRNSYPFANDPFTDRCPICKHHKVLQDSMITCDYKDFRILEDRMKSCKPTKKYYYNILVMSDDGKTFDPTPKMFSVSESFHKQLIGRIQAQLHDITDLNTGKNVVISKTGSFMSSFVSDFRTAIANDCKPNTINVAIMSKVYDLKEVIKSWDKPNDFHFLALRSAHVGYVHPIRGSSQMSDEPVSY